MPYIKIYVTMNKLMATEVPYPEGQIQTLIGILGIIL